MKLPSIFKRKTPPPTSVRLEVTGAPSSVFSVFGGDPYAIDVFRAGVDAIARIAGKFVLTPTAHFRDGTTATCDPRLTRVLQCEPNPYMSAYDAVYQMVTMLYVYNNSYTFIERDSSGHVVGLWPLHVSQVEYVIGGDGTLWCAFRFRNGKSAVLAYSDVVHLRRFFNSGDVNGESNDALTPALELADAQNRQAVARVRESGTIRAIVYSKQLLSEQKKTDVAKTFSETWLNPANASGILPLDEAVDVKLVDPPTFAISSEDQAATAKKVLSYLGISECIVDSSFTDEQFSAFEESVVESLSLQIGLEMSRKLYPTGNRTVEVSTSRISYIGNESKVKLLKECLPAGVLSINEARAMLGLAPIEHDYRLQSLNYVDAEIASKYQLFRAGTSGVRTMGDGSDDEQ